METNNSKSNYENVLLTDVPTKLINARNLVKNVPSELLDFCNYLASITNKDLVPIGLIRSLNNAIDDLMHENCDYSKMETFPDVLKKRKNDIISDLRYFPLIVDKIASYEFSQEFRKLFKKHFNDAEPPIDEFDNQKVY